MQTPLGPERLKICELFAEVVHLQYLLTSSPLFDALVQSQTSDQGEEEATVAEGLMTLCDKFVEFNILTCCIVFHVYGRICFSNLNGIIFFIQWCMI